MDMDFQVPGLAGFDAALRNLGTAGARRAGKKALRQATNVVLREARLLSKAGHPEFPNKLTGIMSKSLYTHDRGVIGDNIIFSVDVKRLAYWALFVEYGTSHARAYPFMRPAAENKAVEVGHTIAAVIGPAIELEWSKRK